MTFRELIIQIEWEYTLYRVGIIGVVVIIMMIGGWAIGLTNYMKYLDVSAATHAELHEFSGSEFAADKHSSEVRMCAALFVPSTGKLIVSDQNPMTSNADGTLGSSGSFCNRLMSGAPRFEDFVSPPNRSAFEIGFFTLLFFVVSLVAAFLILGACLSVMRLLGLRAFSSVVIFCVGSWYIATLVIFFTAALTDTPTYWMTSAGPVDYRPVVITHDGRVLTVPAHLFGWTEGKYLDDLSEKFDVDAVRGGLRDH